jgi:phosphoribosylglycinamide formyltransferase-1
VSRKKSLVVLASGAGTTFANLVNHCDHGILQCALVTLLLCNKDGAGCIQIARDRGIPYAVIPRPDGKELTEHWKRLITRTAFLDDPDLVVLAGYDTLFHVTPRCLGKVVNLHPSLLPKYGGKGMYGIKVHEAVLAAKEKESGCTVHFVNEGYDEGQILAQKTVPVLPDDTPLELQLRVQEAERELYPEVILRILDVS